MAKSGLISAIELGSSSITTLIAQVNTDPVSFEQSISVLGASSVPSRGIKKGQIVDIEEAVGVTISSVESAERMAGYNLDSAYIALGGAHIMSQNSHGVVAVSDQKGEISPDDVDRVIEAASAVSLPASRDLIHVVPREYIVDGESGVKDPVGMSGVRLEVETHLVTASGASVKNLHKAIDEVGVDLSGFVYSGIASAESTITKTERELGCVVVDVGGGTTSMAAFIEGSLAYSGVIPIGSGNVTNDLAIGLRVSLDAAEKIKIYLSSEKKKPGRAKPEADLMNLSAIGLREDKKVSKKTLVGGIIKPRLNEIFTMVKLQLEKEDLGARVPSGVIITGGGAEIVGAKDAAKRMLSLPVRIGVPGGVGGLVDDILRPAFATPIGLLLYAANQENPHSGPSLGKRFKLPSSGVAGRLVDTIKDLLP